MSSQQTVPWAGRYGILCATILGALLVAGCGEDAAPASPQPTHPRGDDATPGHQPSTGAGRGSGDAGKVAEVDAATASERDAGRRDAGLSDERVEGSSSDAAAEQASSGGKDGGASASDAGSASTQAPALPTVTDPAAEGPFRVETVATAPGLSSHTLFVPAKLGDNGIKHPIIVWTNGAGGSTSQYKNLLEHFASHGFFVVADKSSGGNHDPEIVEQKAGVAWAIAESERADGPYFGKIDANRIGVAGHSLGSIASFATAALPSVKASIHWSAGLTGNPVGADEAWLQGLHAPAAFFCGGAETRALPRCSGDFDKAPKLPIFYGTLAGVGHTDVYSDPRGGQWGRGGVAFMRWALAGDEAFRSWFAGDDCVLCKNPWTGKSRGF